MTTDCNFAMCDRAPIDPALINPALSAANPSDISITRRCRAALMLNQLMGSVGQSDAQRHRACAQLPFNTRG